MRLFLIFIFSLVYFSCHCQNLILKTGSAVGNFWGGGANELVVGKPIGMNLVIQGIDKDFINVDEDYEIKSNGEFKYTFTVTPEKKGKLVLGPYSLEFNGQKLTSNSLILEIKAKEKDGKIRIVYPNSAKKNEEVIIELIAKQDFLKNISVLDSPKYSSKSAGTSSSKTLIEGKMTSNYIASFKFTFSESGVYKIDGSWFDGIPDGLKIIGEKITIK